MNDLLENSNFIEPFLSKVASGKDFSQDIWIEREVRRQGEGGEVTKANSSSHKIIGKQIHNITDLLQDDIDYCFNKGRFIFRFVTAIAGSGKTALLNYFRELIELEYENLRRSVVVSFDLSAKLRASKNFQNFHDKFYSYILAETIWKILHNPNIKVVGESVLRELVEINCFNYLTQTKDFEIGFLGKFNNSIKDVDVDLQDVLLSVIRKVSNINSQYTFVYLIDELDDAIRENTAQSQEMRAVLKSLDNKISSKEYNNEIRLLIYMAGTSDILNSFINSESASERRFSTRSIALGSGLSSELQRIREKINSRIEGAYKNYEGFDEGFRKVQEIDKKFESQPDNNRRVLGNYCRDYALETLEIYEEYFNGKPEKHFEGSIKQLKDLIESICKFNWKEYLKQPSYRLSFTKITANYDEHIFKPYARLLKDGEAIAVAYGGARNYELLSGYVDRFIQLLKQHSFRSDNENPLDIAFILSPVECSFSLKKKLSSKNIQFVNLSEAPIETLSLNFSHSTQTIATESQNPIDINMASENALLKVFRGTPIHRGVISKIIASRPYEDVEAISRIWGIGPSCLRVIQEKLVRNEICFRTGVFISYNTMDKTEVNKIVSKLKENKISYWMDDQLLAGEEIRKKLEQIIASNQLWAAAIFHGDHGPGPWQEVEISSLLSKSVKHQDLIIPVILKSCRGKPEVSPFLENIKWVDFREKTPDPIDFLVRSIKREAL